MTLQRVKVTWPNDVDRVEVGEKLREAHDAVEDLVWRLESNAPADAPAEFWPDPAPTLETIGAVYDLLDTVRSHIRGVQGYEKRLAERLDVLNLLRENYAIQVRRQS